MISPTVTELASFGYWLAIDGVSAMLASYRAVRQALEVLHRDGHSVFNPADYAEVREAMIRPPVWTSITPLKSVQPKVRVGVVLSMASNASLTLWVIGH